MTDKDDVRVGVIGVGHMGAHHARVLDELRGVELVGVADADQERAGEVAGQIGTDAYRIGALLARVDAVTIAVPTPYHYETAMRCIQADVDVLVEKPFVEDVSKGERLAKTADARDIILQVGHIERFNPAIQALFDLVDPEDVVALRADRLGPPVDREGTDDVVIDLMIHDIDILLKLMDAEPGKIAGVDRDGSYASVLMTFDDDVVATLTASRVTQRKVRRLEVTTHDRLVIVDYIDQSIRIHRRSRPSYARDDDEMRYRHESVIEQPLIESAEPLKLELEAFVEAVRNRTPPVVNANDGLAALKVVQEIQSSGRPPEVEVPPQ